MCSLVSYMKHLFLLSALLASSLFSIAQQIDENSIPDQYIVQLNGSIDGVKFFETATDMKVLQCLSKHMNIWLIQSETKDILATLKTSPWVKVVQYNHTGIKHRALMPNDSLYNLQWNMPDISAPDAWQLNHRNVTVAGDSIVIAIVDGGIGEGFDIYHPDINFFINHQEIPNNNIDDDGNGFIDDYHGWNIFSLNDSVYSTVGGSTNQHATHVSGIAAAKGNNTIGVAGVSWGTKILAVNGAANDDAHVIMAYDYVIEMRKIYDQTGGAKGAFIVATNSSFGIDMESAANHPIWCAMYDSMGAYGILSAAATANGNWNVDDVGDMPTTCPSRWLIAVTNTTRTDVLNIQAAYGPINVDLGAPGTSIMSCYPDSSYGYDAGTSMASPHVAGTVAALFANACPGLLQSYFANPDSIALLMKDYILQSTDPLVALQYKTASGGRLDLYHALLLENTYNCNNCSYPASVSQQNLLCYGDSSASISAVTGSNSNLYHYLWSNGDTTSTVSGLKAGYYQVTITDGTGCQRQLVSLVGQPSQIVISSINIISITDTTVGNIIISASSGSDTLSYALDGGSYQSTAIFATSTTGVHVIHIRNQSGCVLDTTVGIYYSGVSELLARSPISVYPNPSTGSFYFDGLNNGDAVEVYDMLGQHLTPPLSSEKPGTVSKGEGGTAVADLSGVAKGVYFYKVTNQGRIVGQGKLVVE
jgi:hypothetical protein